MKRSRIQRTDIDIDKCVIVQLDLPFEFKSKLYWHYLKQSQKDLRASFDWLLNQLRTRDNYEVKQDIKEFKRNHETNI